MKDILQWIPNFFKGMLEVLKEMQKMAGNGKKGQVVFWVAFALLFVGALWFLAFMSNPAYESVQATLSHFSINISHVSISIPSSLFPNLLLAFLLTLVYIAVLVGFGGVIGAFIGTATSAIFYPKTTERIDKLFSELMPFLENVGDKDKIAEAKATYTQWNNHRLTRTTRWLNRVSRRGQQKKPKEKMA